MANGRLWEAFTDDERTWYVGAIHDYVLAESLNSDQEPTEANLKWASCCTAGDYIKELNRLYEDRENIRIPIALAMDYLTVKLKGKTPKDLLEVRLMILRDAATHLK